MTGTVGHTSMCLADVSAHPAGGQGEHCEGERSNRARGERKHGFEAFSLCALSYTLLFFTGLSLTGSPDPLPHSAANKTHCVLILLKTN